jgi:hypothetical protein
MAADEQGGSIDKSLHEPTQCQLIDWARSLCRLRGAGNAEFLACTSHLPPLHSLIHHFLKRCSLLYGQSKILCNTQRADDTVVHEVHNCYD